MANLSYGDLKTSNATSLLKIAASYQELLEIAGQFQNPFTEHFNMFTQTSSVFGEKTSIGKGVAIVQFGLEALSQGFPISIAIHNSCIIQAEQTCNNYQGQEKVRYIIRNWNLDSTRALFDFKF